MISSVKSTTTAFGYCKIREEFYQEMSKFCRSFSATDLGDLVSGAALDGPYSAL